MISASKKTLLLFSLLVLLAVDFAGGRLFTVWNDARAREHEKIKTIERAQGRTKSPIYHHGLTPMADVLVPYGPEFYHLRVNSLGLRDELPRKIILKTSRPRILFIGDSFTEGLGINFEDTFAGIAAKKWGQSGVETLNAGVSSYSPIIYLRKIRYLIETVGLQFDQVVLFLDISDIHDELLIYYFDDQGNVKSKMDKPETEAHQEQSPTGGSISNPKESRWIRNSVILRVFDLARSFRSLDTKKSAQTPPAKPADKPIRDYKPVLNWKYALWTIEEKEFKEYGQAGLEIARSHMDELIRLLRAHRINLTLAVYPWADQIYHHDLDSKQVIFWREWALKNRVDFIDYFPYFINERRWDNVLDEFFIPGDVHWNPKGHRLVADVLVSRIQPNSKQEKPLSI